MVIEDMIYLIHIKGLADLIKLTINKEVELHFIDLEQDPPKVKNLNNIIKTCYIFEV